MKTSAISAKTAAIAVLAFIATACSGKSVEVTVENPGDSARTQQTVELPAADILDRLHSDYCYVTDADGNEIPSQVTYDGKLIFQAGVDGKSAVKYMILPSDTAHVYAAKVSGRAYPERADDVAWENELVGFRAYGPATRAKGETAYGYDIFFKHHTDRQILEKLYAPETDPATWVTVDSLRKISDQAAEDYIKTFSYHIDHGLGMDCYAVGPTLGAGVAVPVVGDSLSFSWCYDKAEVLDNGPLRFTVRLDFAPRAVGADSAVTEHRLITLDAGSHLNRTRVWYNGLSGRRRIAAGYPLRDESAPALGKKSIAYADPTQGDDNGKALLGMVFAEPFSGTFSRQGHILGMVNIEPADTLEYYWGFAWSREPLQGKTADMDSWSGYLDTFDYNLSAPLIITY